MKKTLKSLQNFIMCPPRINRVNFLIRVLFWLVGVSFICLELVAVSSNMFDINFEWIYYVAGTVIVIALLFACIARFQDLNMSGWYTPWLLCPGVNFVLKIMLLFCAGTKGSNRYGEEPKNNSSSKNSCIKQTTSPVLY